MRLHWRDFLKPSKSGVFWKNRWIFSKKTWIFFKIAKCVKFFCRMHLKQYFIIWRSFHLIWKVFWLKIRKFFKLENLESMMKKQLFEKKLSSLKKASLPKWEGAKHAGGSRPSCFFSGCFPCGEGKSFNKQSSFLAKNFANCTLKLKTFRSWSFSKVALRIRLIW